MSTKKKLLEMTSNLQLPADLVDDVPADPAPAASAPEGVPQMLKPPPITPRPAAKTGPGQMLQFRGQMLAAEGELGKLRERLREHEGSAPTRKLKPGTIVPSKWANRHAMSFKAPEFMRLKEDIERAGGNVQAIRVRPISAEPGKYEIVFGHRRHRACLELGIDVLATIETQQMSEFELFATMDRENRERADLSPFEQGSMYRRALNEELFGSNRRLAEALGVSHTWVANVLAVADLPPPILDCFRSPLEIQHRHAKDINLALEKDRKGVLRRADRLRQLAGKLAASAVVDTLLGAQGSTQDIDVTPKPLVIAGKQAGKWYRDRTGRVNLQFESGLIPEDRLEEVLAAFARVIAAPR